MGQKVIMFSRLLLHCARLFSRIPTHCFQRWRKTDFTQPCQHRGMGVVNSANLISMKCNLHTVLICISLITNQLNYFQVFVYSLLILLGGVLVHILHLLICWRLLLSI